MAVKSVKGAPKGMYDKGCNVKESRLNAGGDMAFRGTRGAVKKGGKKGKC